MQGTFWLVDGTAVAYRSHYAFINNPLTTSQGKDTSATFGYVRDLLLILEEQKPDYVAVAFDVSRKTFRSEMYEEYKATRAKAPAELKEQWDVIKEITVALGVGVLEKEGWEADDLIGTAARRAEKEGLNVRIVSGDKDMLQLVSDRIQVYDMGKRSGPVLIDAAGVEERFGVPPEKVVDVLALMGDTSDNVPGVPLVGPKKATALIREFGSLETVLERAPAGKPSKTNKNLVEFAEQARLSRRLVTLDTDAPVDVAFRRYDPEARDAATLARIYKELEFVQLYKDVAAEGAAPPADENYRIVRDGPELAALAQDLAGAPFFVLDTETTSVDPLSAEILGISFCRAEGAAAFVPWSGAARDALRPVLEDAACAKGGQNLKFDLQVLQTDGIALQNAAFDTMIASYLLDPGRGNHNLDTLALRHLGVRKTPTEALVGKGKDQISMAEVEEDRLAHYAAEDADCTWRLAEFFRPRLEEMGLRELFDEVEMPLVPVLAAMERAGVAVDVAYLKELGREFEDTAIALEREIHDLAGEVFNVNSPKQLGPILFEKLRIQEGAKRAPRRTRTGSYSTDARALEPFASEPIVAKLQEYREITKLKSTYLDALPQMVHPKTGRIHSSFNQTVAATGRLSSNDPNLQNIPVRTELGRRVRKAFVAPDGFRIVSADYSQIELRLMAHLSGDAALREVYTRGGDIHTETAARMFDLDAKEVGRDQRNSAKAINFGILYGMGPQRLARDLKITLKEAKHFLAAYFREFPGVKEFQLAAVEKARTEGYVTTLLGRRRAIPEIITGDPGVRANAENVAKNTPVQGTAADLIKVAMIRIHRRLKKEGLATRMILQVHDELVFEAPVAEVEPLGALVRAEMEGALDLAVPIVADVGVGRTWLEAH